MRKPTGVITGPWITEVAPSLSWIHIDVTGTNDDVDVRVIALSERRIEVQNDSGFASAEDLLAIGGGLGAGRDVHLTGSHGGPVRYMIVVTVGESAQRLNRTERDLDYTLSWFVHKLDPMVFLMGIILFGMFFVTEYVLSVKRDLRSISKRLDRLAADGGARAPLAALGAPVEVLPPVLTPREEPSELPSGRGGFLGRRGRGAAAEEMSAPPPPPPPTPRYAAAAPPPDLFSPPAYSPPPPEPEAPVYTPPPRASTRAAAPPPPPPAPAPAAAPMAGAEPEPVSRVRCPQCKHIVPVYTAERPTPIKCPNCGKRGMLTK